ncbi:MAG: HepT-like ribonuclease domain-containing protein [Actinomycetota bacterium]
MTRPEQERFSDVPWAAIAGLRNVVVHECFRVDLDLVIDIIQKQLGPLADRPRHL